MSQVSYKVSGRPRITVRFAIGAAVISVKELLLAAFTTNQTALFSTAAEKSEFLRQIATWTAVEGSLEHGSPAATESIFIITDFRAKETDGTGHYPSTSNIQSFGVELQPNSARQYLSLVDLDRVLVYSTNSAVTIGIDMCFEI